MGQLFFVTSQVIHASIYHSVIKEARDGLTSRPSSRLTKNQRDFSAF